MSLASKFSWSLPDKAIYDSGCCKCVILLMKLVLRPYLTSTTATHVTNFRYLAVDLYFLRIFNSHEYASWRFGRGGVEAP